MRLRLLAASAAASALLVLAGCATSAGSGGSTPDPEPSSSATDDMVDTELAAAWLDAGRAVGIVTWGSSSCVPYGEASVDGDTLSVTLTDPVGAACTRDYVPRATVVALPEGVDATEDLEVVVAGDTYSGSVDLDGLDTSLVAEGMTEYEPSAGWTDADGLFVILTWGSSGCVPVVEEVVESAEGELTVVFADPPADQVCTMDMAPRGTVAYVETPSEDSATELVLAGAEFDDVQVSILPN